MENNKPNVTAKDFFLWLGAMVALYVFIVTFILLIHQYIQVWFPDVALEPYGSSFYSETIRFAIASLIVSFPLYVWLTRMLHQDIRKNPLKKELWVRRWLVFLALFVGGLAMAIDFIVVINTFLSGELTTRFLLKALVILVVVGAAFWYYLNELRGTWELQERQSKIVGAVVGIIVLISIVGGFFVVGSPFDERQYRIDEERIGDLSSIQSQIIFYWQAKQELPTALEDLDDPLSGFSVPTDPETEESYVYRQVDGTTFELCATFAKESRDDIRRFDGESWEHEAGEACFERTIDPDKYPPLESGALKPRPAL